MRRRSLIDEVLTDLSKTSKYSAEVKIDAIHSLKGDYSLIQQVLVNLIENALKYSAKKEMPVVEIFTALKNDSVILTVRDNGDGFDMTYVDKLFGVFQRLHNNDQFEGTGIGLAIVHRIVTKHGGVVSVEAEIGKGATFSFSLPIN